MKLLKIGELARLSNINPRTIDYYTSLGLIHPDRRSDTNYRLYSDETILRLKRIELMKREKYTLEEIKVKLDQWGHVTRETEVNSKLSSLQLHMLQLEKEIKEFKPYMEQLQPKKVRKMLKNLTPQTAACIEALIILLGESNFF